MAGKGSNWQARSRSPADRSKEWESRRWSKGHDWVGESSWNSTPAAVPQPQHIGWPESPNDLMVPAPGSPVASLSGIPGRALTSFVDPSAMVANQGLEAELRKQLRMANAKVTNAEKDLREQRDKFVAQREEVRFKDKELRSKDKEIRDKAEDVKCYKELLKSSLDRTQAVALECRVAQVDFCEATVQNAKLESTIESLQNLELQTSATRNLEHSMSLDTLRNEMYAAEKEKMHLEEKLSVQEEDLVGPWTWSQQLVRGEELVNAFDDLLHCHTGNSMRKDDYRLSQDGAGSHWSGHAEADAHAHSAPEASSQPVVAKTERSPLGMIKSERSQ